MNHEYPWDLLEARVISGPNRPDHGADAFLPTSACVTLEARFAEELIAAIQKARAAA
jgi:hypothetical protein